MAITANSDAAPHGLKTIEEVEAEVQRNLARYEFRARFSSIAYPILVVLGALVLWELATRGLAIPVYLLPPPSLVAVSLYDNFALLLDHGWVTTVEILLGYGLSIIIGVPLAIGIFASPPFARSVFPLLVASQAIPKVAIAPLLLVWFGFTIMPKVLIAFLIAFFPIVINTAVGLASIEIEKVHLARSMGFGPLRTFFKIRLPNALPSIFAGLKISITLAVVGAVVGEFVGGDAGLGYLLLVANGNLDTPLLFAGLIALTAMGVAMFSVVELIERLSVPGYAPTGRLQAHESM